MSEINKADMTDLADILEIDEKYGVPNNLLHAVNYGAYAIGYSKGYAEFIVCKNRKIRGEYKPVPDEWEVLFTLGGCGRLNFAKSSYPDTLLYSDEVAAAFDKCLRRIEEYEPLAADRVNNEYLFSVENGYRLYKDYPVIYEETKKEIENLCISYEIQKLEGRLKQLRGEEE